MIQIVALGCVFAVADSARIDSPVEKDPSDASVLEIRLDSAQSGGPEVSTSASSEGGGQAGASVGRPIERRVVVKGRRSPGSAGQRRTTLEGDALAVRRGDDLARTLADVPGMGALSTGGVAKPVLNGLHSQRLPVIVDGIRLEGQSWGGEHAPEVDPFLADRLVVVRGAAGVRYGAGALGGAIVAEPSPLPRVPGFHGEAVGTGSSNGPVVGMAGKGVGGSSLLQGFGWRVQGAGRKGGDLHAPEVVLPNTAMQEASAGGAVGWHRDAWGIELSGTSYDLDQGLLSSAHIGNLTDLRYALERGAPPESSSWSFDPRRPEQKVGHRTVSVRLGAPLPSGWIAGATASTQTDRRREWDVHRAIDAELAALDAPQLDYELRSDAVETVAEGAVAGWRASIGAAVDRQENEYSGRSFVPNYRSKGVGGWLSMERSGAAGAVDAGIRWDRGTLSMWWRDAGEIRSSSARWDGLSAGIGSSLRIAGRWTLRVHAATAWRPPSAVELRADGLHHGTASIEKGDSTLDPERSWTGQVSVDVPGDAWTLSSSAWITRVEDYIALRPVGEPVLTVRGAFPAFRYGALEALLWGGDASMVLRSTRSVEASLRGDLLFTRDESGSPLPFAPVHRALVGVDGVGMRFGPLRDLRAGPRVEWYAEAEPVAGDYAPPPPSTCLLGFESSARIGARRSILVVLAGRNLLNRTWRDPADRMRYFAPRPGASIDARLVRSW